MQPEPLPWDRKDLFKERKQQQHERPSLDASPRRRPQRRLRSVGIGRVSQQTSRSCNQGWHLYSEESGNGFTRSRSNEKIIDDESFWPSDTHADGKYSRSGRENRRSFSQKDWKCHSQENGGSPISPGRPLDVSDQSSVDAEVLIYNKKSTLVKIKLDWLWMKPMDSEDEPANPSIIHEEPDDDAPSERRRYLPRDQKLDPLVASFSCGAVGVISSLMILGANNNIEQQ